MAAAATLVDLVREALSGPERPVLRDRSIDGAWRTATSGDLERRIAAVASALRERGFQPGDRVAICSPNRIDWLVADLGILFSGCVTVPIYATQALDQVDYILRNSGAKLLFLDRPATRKRMVAAGIALPDTICFDGDGDAEAELAAFERSGLQPVEHVAKPEDLAVLVYTSGTTGTPKGVMLSHRNIASNAQTSLDLVADLFPGGDDVLSVLPLAHIYEHTSFFGWMSRRSIIHINSSPTALLNDLRSVRPRVFFAVPRIFERLLASIVAKARAGSRLQAKLVPWALSVGRTAMRYRMRGAMIPPPHYIAYRLAHALVLRKFPPLLGLDRLEFSISGSASLHPDVIATLLAAGITVMEGYGLSECSPIVTANFPGRCEYGTVGRPIPDVELRLGDDGEVFVRGPNVMMGYYNDPDATAALMSDGWFATGDVGSIDKAGYLRIEDRKKELFKTSGGKYVAPARVEAAILRSTYVNQVVVFGNGRSHPAALVSPNWPLVKPLLEIGDDVSTEAAANSESVRNFFLREVRKQTADLAVYERIRYVGVLPNELTIDNGELSPTLKVKRHVVEARYAETIAGMYRHTNAVAGG